MQRQFVTHLGNDVWRYLEQATRGLSAADYRQIEPQSASTYKGKFAWVGGLEKTSSVGENGRRVSIGRKGKRGELQMFVRNRRGKQIRKEKKIMQA